MFASCLWFCWRWRKDHCVPLSVCSVYKKKSLPWFEELTNMLTLSALHQTNMWTLSVLHQSKAQASLNTIIHLHLNSVQLEKPDFPIQFCRSKSCIISNEWREATLLYCLLSDIASFSWCSLSKVVLFFFSLSFFFFFFLSQFYLMRWVKRVGYIGRPVLDKVFAASYSDYDPELETLTARFSRKHIQNQWEDWCTH